MSLSSRQDPTLIQQIICPNLRSSVDKKSLTTNRLHCPSDKTQLMRLHIFQHESSCGPANLLEWADSRDIELHLLRFHEGASIPALDEVEAVIILGGTMNAYQDDQFPHLKAVRAFTRQALLADKKVFGICLGAQIMADALGSSVVRAPITEKGWLEITRLPEAMQSPLLDWLPENHPFVSWHGDTFDIP
ncbi:type 1 glutamine amidotransferase, partial [bacterium]